MNIPEAMRVTANDWGWFAARTTSLTCPVTFEGSKQSEWVTAWNATKRLSAWAKRLGAR